MTNLKITSEEEFRNNAVANSISIGVVNISNSLCIGIAANKKDENAVLLVNAMTGIALANKIIEACLFIAKERNRVSYESIETAPKDGRRIIVADNYQASPAFWDSRGFWNAAEEIEDEPVPLPDTVCYWREINE